MRYQQGWRALNRLLHNDRSFSGHERNCAFLNLGQGDFASVASVAGLDFADDSRGLASCDWDFDGKLDLWQTARTAPRVRFLRNQHGQDNHFVALYLEGNGTTTSRDAIGARVEVHPRNGTKSIKTRHAGDGFLSQASGWLHFGLGEETDIAQVVVRWPGGELETFAGVTADSFHRLEQGTGNSMPWVPPRMDPSWDVLPQRPRPDTQTARIVVPYRLPLPDLDIQWQSEPPPLLDFEEGQASRPTLFTIWTSTCPNCAAELAEWAENAQEFARQDLAIIAVNADQPDGQASEEAKALMSKVGFPFPWGVGSASTISRLDLFQRGVMDRWQPLPVPCSFLVDGNGKVVAIYKGRVAMERVFKDMALIDASPHQLRVAATPFPGRWLTPPPIADPLRISIQMVDHSQVADAIAYLERYLASPDANSSKKRIADVSYVLSVLYGSQKQNEKAVASLQRARELNPEDVRIRSELAQLLGRSGNVADASVELAAALKVNPSHRPTRMKLAVALMQSGRPDQAATHLIQLLQETPRDAELHFLMANCRSLQNDWPATVRHYQEVVRLAPGRLLAANNLAFILAAHPDEKIRDANVALRLADAISKRTNYAEPQLLDTLAVAYGANQQYDKAMEFANKAIELWGKRPGSEASIEEAKRHLELFRQQKPYLENW